MSDVEASGPDRPTEVRPAVEPVAPPSAVSAAPTPPAAAPPGTSPSARSAASGPAPGVRPGRAPAAPTGDGASDATRAAARRDRPGPAIAGAGRGRGGGASGAAGAAAGEAGGGSRDGTGAAARSAGDAAVRWRRGGRRRAVRRPHARAAGPAERRPAALGGSRGPGPGAAQAQDRRHDAGAAAPLGAPGDAKAPPAEGGGRSNGSASDRRRPVGRRAARRRDTGDRRRRRRQRPGSRRRRRQRSVGGPGRRCRQADRAGHRRRADRARRDDARAPPGGAAQGPSGRPLPHGRARQPQGHADRRARGPHPRRALRVPPLRRRSARSTATSTSAGCRTCCPGMEAAFVDIGTPKNAVLYRGDVQYDNEDVEERGQTRDRAAPAGPPDDPLPGHQEPDRPQGRPPHPGGVAARPLRRADPQQLDLRHLQAPARQRAQAPPLDPRPGQAEGARRSSCAPRPRTSPRRRSSATSPPARPVGGDRPRWPRLQRAGAALPRARHGGAGHPRGVQRRVPQHRHRRPGALRGGARLRPRRSRPSSPTGSSTSTRRPSRCRCSSATTCTSSSTRPSTRRCGCPPAGSLIIEHTEALTVIDVNTGKNVGSRSLEETVFHNNLEAAEEIARQLRLRDIGGIIVIDFVDMEIRENRDRTIAGVPGRPGPGQDPHPGVRHLRARPRRDDPQAHRRGPARVASRCPATPASAGAWSSTRPRRRAHAVSCGTAPNGSRLRAGSRWSSAGSGSAESTAMYAVIKAGGKQYRVEEGQQLEVDLIAGADEVDVPARCSSSTATPSSPRPTSSAGAAVAARVVGEAKGPKITGFTYKPKSTSGVAGATASTTPPSRSPASRRG